MHDVINDSSQHNVSSKTCKRTIIKSAQEILSVLIMSIYTRSHSKLWILSLHQQSISTQALDINTRSHSNPKLYTIM
jgi:hypothetical protein